MGLDMYLNRHTYLRQKYNHETKEWTSPYTVKGIPVFSEVSEVKELAMYWRKANQIHGWFVSNIQKGNDDCEEYSVSKVNLRKLRDTCKRVLNNPELASELLPATQGFFFGTDEYNVYYYRDLEDTVETLDKLFEFDSKLEDDDYLNIYYTYRSSW